MSHVPTLKKVCACGRIFFTITAGMLCADCIASPVSEDVSTPSLLEGCYFFDSASRDEEPWDT